MPFRQHISAGQAGWDSDREYSCTSIVWPLAGKNVDATLAL